MLHLYVTLCTRREVPHEICRSCLIPFYPWSFVYSVYLGGESDALDLITRFYKVRNKLRLVTVIMLSCLLF